MELNLDVLEGLTLLGDSVTVPDQAFHLLHGAVHESLMETTKEPNVQIEKLPATDCAVAKQCFLALSTLIVEVSRKNVEETEISSLLDECKWQKDRCDVIIKRIKLNKKELQQQLCRINSSYAHIVDVDWRLDYCVKSNQLEKINESSYMVSLKTEEPGKEGKMEFFCTVDQLQDLVSKLKDATKTLEKASQS